jgi:hypothetical protein
VKRTLGGILAAALSVSLPSVVLALELVPGGYGAVPPEQAGSSDDTVALGGSLDAPTFDLEFTPRGGGALWARPDADEPAAGLRFDLTVHGETASRLDRFGLGTSRDALRANARTAPAALTVGGAMRWSDWSVGGGLGRAQVLGEDVDLMAASLGYGPLTAELAYGQSESVEGAPRDVLMLSTDIAAWSWLTLESNLAVGSRTEAVDGQRDGNREPVAAGRFGLRLNF